MLSRSTSASVKATAPRTDRTAKPEVDGIDGDRRDHHARTAAQARHARPVSSRVKGMTAPLEAIEAGADIAVVLVVAAEELQCLDVRIGIDHAPVQHRRHFGRIARVLADARNEIARQRQEEDDPERDHRRQPPVELGDERHGRGRIDDDEPDDLQQRDDQVAGRLRAGPDLGHDPAGKIVLEEGKRLPRDVQCRIASAPD